MRRRNLFWAPLFMVALAGQGSLAHPPSLALRAMASLAGGFGQRSGDPVNGVLRAPVNAATGVSPDSHLVLTFPTSPTLGTSGQIRIYDAADDRLVTDEPFNPNTVSRFPVFCQAFIGDYLDIDVVPDGDGEKVAIVWNDNRNVDLDGSPETDDDPLTPDECAEFRTQPDDPSIQDELNDGSLDQDTVVEVNP